MRGAASSAGLNWSPGPDLRQAVLEERWAGLFRRRAVRRHAGVRRTTVSPQSGARASGLLGVMHDDCDLHPVGDLVELGEQA